MFIATFEDSGRIEKSNERDSSSHIDRIDIAAVDVALLHAFDGVVGGAFDRWLRNCTLVSSHRTQRLDRGNLAFVWAVWQDIEKLRFGANKETEGVFYNIAIFPISGQIRICWQFSVRLI